MKSSHVRRASIALLALGAVLSWASCGDETSPGADAGADAASQPADAQAPQGLDAAAPASDASSTAADAAASPPDAALAGLDAATAGLDAAGPPDTSVSLDASSRADSGTTLSYTDAGCLSYSGANQVCGDGSPGTLCAFSVECGASSSGGQCNINCTMGSMYSACYGPDDVACLQDAMAADDCTAFKACGWVL